MSSSFSLKAYTEVLSLDFCYPSACKLTPIEDKGSIRDSLSVERFNIFDQELLETPLYQNILAVVVRVLANYCIGLIVAPAGVLWNGVHLGWHFTVWITEDVENPESLKKVEQYATAFFADLCFAIAAALGPLNIGFGMIEELPDIAIIDIILGILNICIFSVLSAMPDYVLPLITNQEDRAGFYKSIMLKSEFGIVSTNGKLLSFDLEKDQESENLDGHFAEIYKQQAMIFLKTLNRLQRSLPANQRLYPCYPPTWKAIQSALPEADMLKWQAKFCKIESNIKRIEEILKTCIALRHTNLCNIGEVEITMPPFPCLEGQSNAFFDVNYLTGWDKMLQDAQLVLENKNLSEQLELYRKRIMAGMGPKGLLGLREGETLAQAYRRVMLQVAPDKNPGYNTEAGVIFYCVQEARNSLNEGDNLENNETPQSAPQKTPSSSMSDDPNGMD